jgi:hypothetical protein
MLQKSVEMVEQILLCKRPQFSEFSGTISHIWFTTHS